MSSKGTPVILHIYDVPDANKYIHLFTDSIGVYHTGVEIYKNEYSFGGHPHDYTGIFKTPPKDIKTLSVSETFQYKESKIIGNTTKDEEEVICIVDKMGKEFKGKSYHLIRKNCNHFSNAFCKKLCGKGIPESINKMVELIRQYPIIETQIPKEFVTPKALEKDVKQHEEEKKRQKKDNQLKKKEQNKEQTNNSSDDNSGSTGNGSESDSNANTGTPETSEEPNEKQN